MFDTKILDSSYENCQRVASFLMKDEIVALPSETVYGLCGNAFSAFAVKKIFAAKGRPSDNPLILHVDSLSMFETVAKMNKISYILFDNFCPGSLTMVLPKNPIVIPETNCGLDTVAVRVPKNKVFCDVISLCNFPLAAPSANISGRPSPTSALDVFEDMNGKIPFIIDGGNSEVGIESTVVLVRDNLVQILRLGAVTSEMISKVLGNICTVIEKTSLNSDSPPLSPGTKYKHYSPRGEVLSFLTSSDNELFEIAKIYKINDPFIIGFSSFDVKNYYGYGETSKERARNLFAAFREADRCNAKKVIVRLPDGIDDLDFAVVERISRASEGTSQ